MNISHPLIFLLSGLLLTFYGSLSAQTDSDDPAGSQTTFDTRPLPQVPPEVAGMDPDHLSRVDDVIREAIEEEETPGAVLLVIRNNMIVWREGYGSLSAGNLDRPATPETIYDLASLTKPVATATALMQLLEQGKLRLMDPVSRYLPEFQSYPERDGSESVIRVIHLLTHTSGLPSYPPVDDLREGAIASTTQEVVYNWLDSVERDFTPGEGFQYSCPNFVTVQRIVETVTDQTLADYTRTEIFEPLGMVDTGYNPPPDREPETAPTDLMIDSDEALVCTVHDPFARELMHGNSGNAGLFSTADDLAIFAAMMMNEGEWQGKRILSPASVRTMTRTPEGLESYGRGLGWDLSSSYASNQGDLFGPATYGHTGFTGTSLIVDPDTDTAVILLSNRTFPEGGGGSVVRLRSLVANIVAASILE